MNIIKLNPSNSNHIQAVSKLHLILLPDSPIAQMGPLFMQKFYYSKLVKDQLISCNLYHYQGKYVGFISYTKYPFSFIQKGKQRYSYYLIFLIFLVLLQKPSRLLTLLQVMRQNRRRQMEKESENIGEVLSFGVLKEYRHLKDESDGFKISHVLFQSALRHFQNEGFRAMQVSVKKDNDRALQFYSTYTSSVKENAFDGKGQCFFSVDCNRADLLTTK